LIGGSDAPGTALAEDSSQEASEKGERLYALTLAKGCPRRTGSRKLSVDLYQDTGFAKNCARTGEKRRIKEGTGQKS